jgi:hypothetical protein
MTSSNLEKNVFQMKNTYLDLLKLGELSTRKLLFRDDIVAFQKAVQSLMGICHRAEWWEALKRLDELRLSSETAVPAQIQALSTECRNIVQFQSGAAQFVVASEVRVDETVRISGVFRDAAARFPELSAEFYLMCGHTRWGFMTRRSFIQCASRSSC